MASLTQPNGQLTQDTLRDIIELQSELGSLDFNLAKFMDTLVTRVQELTGATGAVVELQEGNDMVYTAAAGNLKSFIGLRMPVEESFSGYSLVKCEIAICENTQDDKRVSRVACEKINARSMMVVPLRRKQEALGVLKVISSMQGAFNDFHAYTLRLLAGLLGGALGQQMEIANQQREHEYFRHMAHYDTLTGLPNRSLLYDRLEHALTRNERIGKRIALMYMDIDHFKTINDTYGHAVGDKLLREFAERVRHVTRSSDTLARLGGDEFILVTEELKNDQEAPHIAQKILAAISQPITLAGHTLQVSTSIGIAVSMDDPLSADAFIHQADTALYQAKQAGRGTYKIAASS